MSILWFLIGIAIGAVLTLAVIITAGAIRIAKEAQTKNGGVSENAGIH